MQIAKKLRQEKELELSRLVITEVETPVTSPDTSEVGVKGVQHFQIKTLFFPGRGKIVTAQQQRFQSRGPEMNE